MSESVEQAPAAPMPMLTQEQFAQLLQALTQQKAPSLDADMLREILASQAAAVQKAMKPENTDHPGLSVFSHKDGDLKMPKPPLPYQLFWNGYPVHKFPETETWKEWLVQSNMPGQGTYSVIRNDGSKMLVTVTAETDADGKPTKLTVTHPNTREDKDKIPSKPVIIAQMLDPANGKQQFIKAMQEQFAGMFGES